MRSWYKNFNLTVNWSDREWNSSITMVKVCLSKLQFKHSFSIVNTYAVVVAPNTKRATAADLKCTILLYGFNGLGKEDCWECSSSDYEWERGSANHGKKSRILVCWTFLDAEQKSSARCGKRRRLSQRQVQVESLILREEKQICWCWTLFQRKVLIEGQTFVTWFERFQLGSVNEDPASIRGKIWWRIWNELVSQWN